MNKTEASGPAGRGRKLGRDAWGLLVASVAGLAPVAVRAEPAAATTRNWLQVGTDVGAVRATYRADPFLSGGRGTELHFQEEAGHPQRPASLRLEVGRALGQSWFLAVEAERWSSSGQYTPAAAVRLAETSFDALRPLSTRIELRQFAVLGGYRWLVQPEAEWGLLFGGGGLAFDADYSGRTSGVDATRSVSERVTRLQLGLYGRRDFGPWGEAALRIQGGSDSAAQLAWRWPLGASVRLEAAYRWARVDWDPVPLGFMQSGLSGTGLNITRSGPRLSLRADF